MLFFGDRLWPHWFSSRNLTIQLILITLFFLVLYFTVLTCTQLIEAYEHSEYFLYGIVCVVDNWLPSENARLVCLNNWCAKIFLHFPQWLTTLVYETYLVNCSVIRVHMGKKPPSIVVVSNASYVRYGGCNAQVIGILYISTRGTTVMTVLI